MWYVLNRMKLTHIYIDQINFKFLSISELLYGAQPSYNLSSPERDPHSLLKLTECAQTSGRNNPEKFEYKI